MIQVVTFFGHNYIDWSRQLISNYNLVEVFIGSEREGSHERLIYWRIYKLSTRN
jgi:hypothetical protein